MAKKINRKQAQGAATPQYTCRDCTFSYDWHEIGANGKPFMCRCAYYTDGKYCKFLSGKQCEHFEKRKDNGKAE